MRWEKSPILSFSHEGANLFDGKSEKCIYGVYIHGMRRKIYSIRINPEVWEKARKLGLNISRVCENALIQEINRISQTELKNGGNLGGEAPGLVRPPGFEPGLSARGADVLDQARRRPHSLLHLFQFIFCAI